MEKKLKLQAAATEKCSEQEKKKNFETMVKYGEPLSNELIEVLSKYGNSAEGLLIETYAICKAYGALIAIAQDANYDVEPLFLKMLPWFIEEAEKMLSGINEEEVSNQ